MFISRPFEPKTVLLWGRQWWLPGEAAPLDCVSLADAPAVLADFYREEPKPIRLRLLYQPDPFESVPVGCPLGGRLALASALAGDYPALTKPDQAWSHEPVLVSGEGHQTVLHFETEPHLLDLAARLARLGLAVEAAWPLATYLHALPEEWSDSGAITVAAVQSGRAIAYHHPSSGVRMVHTWRGDGSLDDCGRWLASALTKDSTGPVLLVVPDDAAFAALDSRLPLSGNPSVEVVTLADALARPVTFARAHPAQLLPRPLAVTSQLMLIAASVAFLLIASWAGVQQAASLMRNRQEAAAQAAELTALRSEVAALQARAADIVALRRRLDAESATLAAHFLRRLSATIPNAVVLSSLRLAEGRYELAGWVASQAPTTLLEEWRAKLDRTAQLQQRSAGAFTLSGEFVR